MPKAGITYGPRIPAPDYAQIAEDAQAATLKTLGVQASDRLEEAAAKANPAELLKKAAAIVAQADAEIGVHAGERDQALAHLYFYEPRLGMARAAGLSNVGYRNSVARAVYGAKDHPLPDVSSNSELAAIGRKLRVPRVDDAEVKLLEAAQIVHAARARRDLAVRFVQEAVWALSQPPYEWDTDRIAEHVDVDRKLIYRQRDAARHRRGL